MTTKAQETNSSRRRDQPRAAPIRILQAGPLVAGPDSRGGIATVMALIMEHPDRRFHQIHVPTYVDGSRARKLATGASGMTTIARHLAARDVDVLHLHLSFKGSVLRKGVLLHLARAAGVPTVVHAHSHGFSRWFDGLPPWRRAVVRRLLISTCWLTLGERWRDEYAQRLHVAPKQVHVVRNPAVPQAPVSLAAYPRPATLPGQFDAPGADPPAAMGIEGVGTTHDHVVTAAFLGRLGERKGCYDLVRAVAQLPPDSRRRLRLVMAGDGEVAPVRQAAQEAGVEGLIEFPGWIDPDERARLLQSAEVVLLPSYQEGLPMAVLEGMAAGCAVLTTPVGAIGEVLEDGRNGLLVAPGDVPALAEAIDRLLRDAELRDRLGAEARSSARELSVERWYEHLSRIWLRRAGAPGTHA